jgi:sulfur-carrier protein
MAMVRFTANIQRHVACGDQEIPGETVRAVLEAYFTLNTVARSYVLDDQGGLRRHMAIYVDGQLVRDRAGLLDPVGEAGTVFVFQALSGG